LNVAVAVLFWIMVKVQVPVVFVPIVTEHTSSLAVMAVPPHAVKVDEVPAVAVRVTKVPLAYRAVQVPDSVNDVVDVAAVCVQFIWLELSVTVPEPAPCRVTMRLNVRFAPATKISSRPLVSRGPRLFAKEIKLTAWPSPVIDGTRLLPSAGGGDVPPGWLARKV
jgi:hypothetical protein